MLATAVGKQITDGSRPLRIVRGQPGRTGTEEGPGIHPVSLGGGSHGATGAPKVRKPGTFSYIVRLAFTPNPIEDKSHTLKVYRAIFVGKMSDRVGYRETLGRGVGHYDKVIDIFHYAPVELFYPSLPVDEHDVKRSGKVGNDVF